MQRITNIIAGRRTSWIVLVGTLLVAGAIFVLGSGSSDETAPGVGLPDSAESARVAAFQDQLPGADATSALLVFSRDGDTLTDADLSAIADVATALTDTSSEGFVPPA